MKNGKPTIGIFKLQTHDNTHARSGTHIILRTTQSYYGLQDCEIETDYSMGLKWF